MLEGCAPLTYFRARPLGAHPSCVPALHTLSTLEACAPKCALGSLHFPLLDAGRPVRLHRNFEAQAARRHGFEGDLVEPVLLDIARVGQGSGLALDSLLGIQTTIWPRPRFAHA